MTSHQPARGNGRDRTSLKAGGHRADAEGAQPLAEPGRGDGPSGHAAADVLLELHDPAAALPYLERIISVTNHTWGPNDLRLVAALRRLAAALTACDRTAEAIPVLERVVALNDYYGAETTAAVNDLRRLAGILEQYGRSEEAHSHLEYANDIDQRHQKAGSD